MFLFNLSVFRLFIYPFFMFSLIISCFGPFFDVLIAYSLIMCTSFADCPFHCIFYTSLLFAHSYSYSFVTPYLQVIDLNNPVVVVHWANAS